MKIILDMDDNVLKNIQDFCNFHHTKIEDLISNLFTKYIFQPSVIMEKLYKHKNDYSELYHFQKLFIQYINDAILDLESTLDSDVEYEEDKIMMEVFKRLGSKHIHDPYFMTDLFTVYWDSKMELNKKELK